MLPSNTDLNQLCLRVARRPTTQRMIAKRLRAAVRAGAEGDPVAAARYAIGFAGTGISVPSATELRRALGRSTGLLVDTGADVRQAVRDELRARIEALWGDQARAEIELAAVRGSPLPSDAPEEAVAARARQVTGLKPMSQTRRPQIGTLASLALTLGFPEIFDEWVF